MTTKKRVSLETSRRRWGNELGRWCTHHPARRCVISLLAIQLFEEKGTEDMNGFSELGILLSQLVHNQPEELMSLLSI
jgi:hypothetical protein